MYVGLALSNPRIPDDIYHFLNKHHKVNEYYVYYYYAN